MRERWYIKVGNEPMVVRTSAKRILVDSGSIVEELDWQAFR